MILKTAIGNRLIHLPTRLVGAACLWLGASVSAIAEVDFARDIRPILNAKCTECHGGVKAAGDVSFIYQEQVINFEGDSGYPVVKPGDTKESELFYRITTDDPDEAMPPREDHPPLSKDEIALIKQWIEEGAEWSDHWAFVPPRRPQVPRTKFEASANNDIDRFLFHRLEQKGWQPGSADTPGRLLRRLHLALTGLPPSLEEIDAFQKNHAAGADAAVEAVVDDLLARPAFGERWAAMWLDLVRYADSGGLGQDQRRTIWAYRDWVVRAFNNDLPFDQFTIRQLAGDLLPEAGIDELVATACQRNTQTNNEGGTDDETFRMEAVIDRVNTTWQTWGSVTFGCVQCHDHPYDPIRMTEYYQFMDFFNNSADSDLPNEAPVLRVPNDPSRYAEAEQLSGEIFSAKRTIWNHGTELKAAADWCPVEEMTVNAQNGTRYVVAKSATGVGAEFHTVGTVQAKTHTRIEVPATAFDSKAVTALSLSVLPLDPEAARSDPEWGFVIEKTELNLVDANGKQTPVALRHSVPDVPWMPTDPWGMIGADGRSWGADSRIHHQRDLVLVPAAPVSVPEGGKLVLYFHCNKSGHGHPMVMKRGRLATSADPRWTQLAAPDGELAGLVKQVGATVKKFKQIPGTTVPILQKRQQAIARPTHLFARGNMLEKEDLVSAGLPSSLTAVAPMPGRERNGNSRPDRLAMARWWVSETHPLTARVFVNRLWEQLFGVGIVPTLEDFGSSGEKPTHPELLDYLALRFQKDHAWSIKTTVREMVLSHAFRQSNRISPELAGADPDNRYLARGPRLRLSAEQVRDQALALSGLLSDKIGGPPVHPPIPEGVWRPFEAGDKWDTPKPTDQDRYRRSIYTYLKRSIPYPTFATFDAPSREFCTPRRLKSNTPLQALVTLNDAAFFECAEELGKRIGSDEFSGTTAQRLSRAHLLATGRQPGEKRLAELTALYEHAHQSSQGDNAAAWTVLAQLLLNLDETLTY